MDIAYETKYHQLEELHWWFQGRRAIVMDLITKLQLPRQTAAILEIGCSGGPLMLALRTQGYRNLTGIDISAPAIEVASARGLDNVSVMDGASLQFADAAFDVVIASDVLEHIADEGKALAEWKRVLKPGGTLIVFVPAFGFLWSRHDEVNHHYRRYTKPMLLGALDSAGFGVQRSSFWNCFLFPPTLLVRSLQNILNTAHAGQASGGDNLLKLNPLANALLRGIVRTENFLLRHVDLPVGVSVFAIATKA